MGSSVGRNHVRGVSLERLLEMHRNQDTSALRVLEPIGFGTSSAEPEMLNRVRIGWLPVIQGALVKAKEAPLMIIKFRLARRIGTRGKHVAPLTRV